MRTSCSLPFALAALFLASPFAAVAQDHLEAARAHYEAAAYEEALTALAHAEATGVSRLEVEQYRAMCLLALGRTAEATEAVGVIVAADPQYVPPASIASPKVQALVAEVREAQLPDIIRSLVTSGRTAFEQKAFDRASTDFSLALRLLDDPILKDWPERKDVRVLADGFAALTAASARGADARAVPTAALASSSLPAAPGEPLPGVAATTGTLPPIGPEPLAEPAADLVIEAPVAILQTMPAWVPPDPIAQTRDFEGVLKIEIGVDGRVKSASMEEPSHPAYDARLLHAARQWVFRPATRDGQPVESEKLIAIQLHPRK